MANVMTFKLPDNLKQAFRAEMQKTIESKRIQRIWERDATVWTGSDEAKWLGWLDVVDNELATLEKYRDLRADAASRTFEDTVLMGMGGSSLCPEVFAITFGKDDFHILDSTVPAQIAALEAKLDLKKTLFIVSSKSGSTLEPNCFKEYFFEKVSKAVGLENAGKHFIAVTDPGSMLEKEALIDGFRQILHGDPEIGGRFSALSPFGMTAAAAMGLDLERILNRCSEMVRACKASNPDENPGAKLGTILGICHREGRDKLTILTSPEIYDIGAWLEQLIAESTGKNGTAIIPVDREPLQPSDVYGNDRLFVHLSLKGTEIDEDLLADLAEIEEAGHPIVNIEVEDLYCLCKEFFRWEFATAVAGSIMGINTFNQPDVEAAKVEARKLTDEFEKEGSLPPEEPFFEQNGIALFSSPDYARSLEAVVEERSLSGFIEAHFWNLAEDDYFAILAYLKMNSANEDVLQQMRTRVLEHYSVATCLGFGPRFLHSTGQAYKGGGNNGVFLQITSDDSIDLAVPGRKYTFGTVKAAQARGDFQVLLDRGRRALRVHLGTDVEGGLQALLAAIH